MIARLILRHLAFIGTDKATASISFESGPNVIFGASNTGKSFTLAALEYMFGSSGPLPAIEQAEGYEAALLGLELPHHGPVTLYRSLSGGGLRLYAGLHREVPEAAPQQILAAEHDSGRTDTLSHLILSSLGLDGKFVVRNENGEKNSFTLRSLDPFMFVNEGSIIGHQSPILSGQYIGGTAERNSFRLLLTGKDDASVVPAVPPKIKKARQDGQRELLEQWIADIDQEIGTFDATREELAQQETRLNAGLADLTSDLAKRQKAIDTEVLKRRQAVDARDRTKASAREIELTLARFARLLEVYDTDIGRLSALEQGGHMLLTRLGRPCPLCGAEDEHQHKSDARDVARAKETARAEIARIDREQRDLASTIALLEADAGRSEATISALDREITESDTRLGALRPTEATLREDYEVRIAKRDLIRDALSLFEQRDRLAVQLSQISARPKEKKTKHSVGIDGPTGHAFSVKVEEVLQAWGFPGNPSVSFDPEAQDIRLNGKERRANGKGVRAVIHSAFKVAVLLYCQENKLPHPGLLVLDTPLLTYREPAKVPRYGALTSDERALAGTTLHQKFYAHLASLSDRAQFLILENSDPPVGALPVSAIHFFTGDEDEGRMGLFPAADGSGEDAPVTTSG